MLALLTTRKTEQKAQKPSDRSTAIKHVATVAPVDRANQTAVLETKRTLAHQTIECVFSLSNGKLNFRPGQFISVRVGLDEWQNAMLRSYSIASWPGENTLRLILRLVPDGPGTRFFSVLRPFETMQFTGPMGFFVNELGHPGDVVYVATGTGIAAIAPMLAQTLAEHQTGQVHLLWGLRHEQDLFYQAEIEALAAQHPHFCAQVFLSQPRGGWPRIGRVVAPLVELVPKLIQPTFYLCGNGQMIEECKAALKTCGIDRKRQIRTEAFFD